MERPREYSRELLVHFDVTDKRLTIDEFYQTAKTIQILTNSFNQLLFKNKSAVGVYIRPPQPGGVIEILDLVVQHPIVTWVLGAWGGLFLEGIITDLTNKNINELGQAFSAQTRKLLLDIIHSSHRDYQKLKIDVPVGLELLKMSIVKFLLEKPNLSSIKTNIILTEAPEAALAKSRFYTMCAKSGKIRGLGFSRDHNFPVKQNDFMKYVLPEPIQQSVIQTRFELHNVTIVCPVNIADSQVQWKTQDKFSHKKISFYMTDDKFRNEFLSGQCPLKETKKDDEMLVYIEYITTFKPNGKKQERRNAIKVFRFNDRVLAPVPNGIQLNVANLTANPMQGELFDVKTYEK